MSTGDDIRHIHIVVDAQQIFPFPDLNVGIPAYPLHHEYVEPVPEQLPAVPGDKAFVSQQRVHRVYVFENCFLAGCGQIGVKSEIMREKALMRQRIHDRSAGLGIGWPVILDHVVQEIVKQMPGVNRDTVQFRHDAVYSEGLVPDLSFFYDGSDGLRYAALRSVILEVLGGHVSVLAVRSGHLVPSGIGLGDNLY